MYSKNVAQVSMNYIQKTFFKNIDYNKSYFICQVFLLHPVLSILKFSEKLNTTDSFAQKTQYFFTFLT